MERRVERSGKRLELTSKEFSLLEYLMLNAGRRVTRAMIIEHAWNLSFDTSTNVVDVYPGCRCRYSHAIVRRLSHGGGSVQIRGKRYCFPHCFDRALLCKLHDLPTRWDPATEFVWCRIEARDNSASLLFPRPGSEMVAAAIPTRRAIPPELALSASAGR